MEMDNKILNQIKAKRNTEELFEPQKCEEEPKFHAKCDPSAKINTDIGSEAFMLKDMKLKERNVQNKQTINTHDVITIDDSFM